MAPLRPVRLNAYRMFSSVRLHRGDGEMAGNQGEVDHEGARDWESSTTPLKLWYRPSHLPNGHYLEDREGERGGCRVGGVAGKDSMIRVCIWGSNKMDGQKQIWLQQLRDMDKVGQCSGELVGQ